MKKFLRLLVGLCPDRGLSVISYRPSDTGRRLITISQPFDRSKASYFLRPFLLLILVFVSCGAVLAQEPVGHTAPAAKADAEITALKIGDRVPDELWEMYFPVVSANSDQVQYLSLGDFKDKLIILDFWSTWCGSCIAAFPSNLTLANEFKDDLLIMPVGLNNEVEIRKFMATHKNGKYLPESIMDKEILKQYFPHRFIPHYVWIYNGKLESITDSDQLKSIYVNDILNDKAVAIRQKVDMFDFNIGDPFDKNWDNLFKGKMVVKSTLTKFVGGVGGGWESVRYDRDSTIQRSAAVNRMLINIYKLAVDKPWNFFLNEASDLSLFHDVDKDPHWTHKNTYCYELLVTSDVSTEKRNSIIINDLNTKLDLNSRLETRMMDCYVMVYDQSLKVDKGLVSVVGPTKKMKLDEIAVSFNNRRKFDKHTYQSPPILVNELQNEEDFFYLFTDEVDIESFNAFMKPQGIMAIPAKREIEVFILSDY